MKKYFSLHPIQGRGTNVFINAVLAEEFDEKNPMPPMSYKWNNPSFRGPVDFPDFLWLVCKEKLLSFDYHPQFNGFIVSEEFLSLLKEYRDDGFQTVPLKVISWKGKNITEKTYYYIQFYQWEDCLDYEKSKFQVKENTNPSLVTKAGFGIERFEDIVLKQDCVSKEVFLIYVFKLQTRLWCGEEFKAEAQAQKLYGFEFVPTEGLAAYRRKKFFD